MLRRRVQMVLLVYVSDYWTAPEHLQLNPQKRCSCLVSRSLLCLCPCSFSAQAGREAYFNKETCALQEQLAVHVSLDGRITDIPNLFHFYSCLYIVITFVFIFKCDGCVCTRAGVGCVCWTQNHGLCNDELEIPVSNKYLTEIQTSPQLTLLHSHMGRSHKRSKFTPQIAPGKKCKQLLLTSSEQQNPQR